MTEIRQASPFPETKTAAIRVPSRAAGNPVPAFELPSADRAAEVRQNAPRSNPVRDAAHARNAARDVARDTAENERPPRPSSTRSSHSHADDKVHGANRQADTGAEVSADGAAEQADKGVAANTQATGTQDSSSTVAGDVNSAEAETGPAEAAATQMTTEALQLLQVAALSTVSPPAGNVPVPETQSSPVPGTDAANTGLLTAPTSAAEAGTIQPPVVPQVAGNLTGSGVEGEAEATQAVLAGGGGLSPKSAAEASFGEAAELVGQKAEDALKDEAGKFGQTAKTEGETAASAGKADKEQPVQAAEAKIVEVKIPAEATNAARDARIELPAGFSLAAPKAALDPNGLGGTAPLPDGQPHVAESRPTPINAVPLEIGLRALSGSKRFDIRLDPAELGRVDVRLEIDDAGIVTAKLTVDRVETLHLLQRDARTLERAFEQAGLKPSDGGVDISLRDQTGQQGSGQAARDESEQNARRSRAFIQVEPEIAEAQVLRRALGPGRIDLSI